MIIEYDKKSKKFLIQCTPEENQIVMGLPDRRFRKTTRIWAAPCLRRNVEYMAQHMSNPQMYSTDALCAFTAKRKELSEKPKGELQFPFWYDFKNPPMKHQKGALDKFFPLNEAAIFFEQGLGKTYTSINLAAAWRITNNIEAAVVVCPSSIKLVWEDELAEHCPIDHQVHILESGKYKKAEAFTDEFMDFKWMVVGVEALSQGNAFEYVKAFMAKHRCAMVIDESSRIKTNGKTRTDRCITLGTMAYKRVILSGTSITQGLEDLYSQYKFLNPEIIGYDSYYSYRARYCATMQMVVGYDDFGRERTVTKIIGYKNEDELISTISPYTLRVEKKDALDLPEKIYQNRYIEMNKIQKKMYEEMKHELMVELGDHCYEVKTVLEKILRLQQITGGHYPQDDGEKVTPIPIPGKNPKIEELMDVLDETSGKVVIWCQFRSEIKLVEKALQKSETEYVLFHGGCSDEEKTSAVREFRKNPGVKVFLATRAAAYGLTLIEASTAIYYSQGYSLEEYAQSQDRIHRIGQDNHCTYIHMLANKTIDVDIINALLGKKHIADLMYSLMKNS